MNFNAIILLIIYICLENLRIIFGIETIPTILLAEDSPQKIASIKYAYKKINDNVLFRVRSELDAQREVNYRISKFEYKAKQRFHENMMPLKVYKAQNLWLKALEAFGRLHKVQSHYYNDRFCQIPVSANICESAFRNPYFSTENLTYDSSKPKNGNECTRVTYSLKDPEGTVNLSMEYKTCFATKRNEDNSVSSVRVILQSAWDSSSWTGKTYYFVLFPFIRNPATGKLERLEDQKNLPDGTHIQYRYEAYLFLRLAANKPDFDKV